MAYGGSASVVSVLSEESAGGRDSVGPAMVADPIDPGAMPLAAIVLTAAQVRAFVDTAKSHPCALRIEQLGEGYARVVLLDPEGKGIKEQLLFPT